MKSRRQALALAGALTLTVIAAVAAVAGMSRGATTARPAQAAVVTQVASQPAGHFEGGDD